MAEYIDRQTVLDALQAPEMFGITPYHIELIKQIPCRGRQPVFVGGREPGRESDRSDKDRRRDAGNPEHRSKYRGPGRNGEKIHGR